MPLYVARVADEAGKIEKLIREAASEEPLLRELSSARRFVLSVKELPEGEGAVRAGRRFSRKEVEELTGHLALMLSSGLSLKDSLDVAQAVSSRGSEPGLVAMLLEKIRKGSTFADALDCAGRRFPPLYRGMVRIGERIGSLDRVFVRISSYMKDRKKLHDHFMAALLYPAMVTAVALAAGVLILTVLFPRLRQMFSQIGPGMAGPVESLMSSLTAGLTGFGAILVGVILFLLWASRVRRRGGRLAEHIDACILRTPVLSTVVMQHELLNLASAMEALTDAGVSVEEALREAAGAVENTALRLDVLAIRQRVLKGEHLSAACAGSAYLPSHISRWAGIGEQVGRVEKVFGQLRAYYQQEVEKWMHRLMALIEPALVVTLGIMIILFVVLFIVPLFSLYGAIL